MIFARAILDEKPINVFNYGEMSETHLLTMLLKRFQDVVKKYLLVMNRLMALRSLLLRRTEFLILEIINQFPQLFY